MEAADSMPQAEIPMQQDLTETQPIRLRRQEAEAKEIHTITLHEATTALREITARQHEAAALHLALRPAAAEEALAAEDPAVAEAVALAEAVEAAAAEDKQIKSPCYF